jgi:hypothetical protein
MPGYQRSQVRRVSLLFFLQILLAFMLYLIRSTAFHILPFLPNFGLNSFSVIDFLVFTELANECKNLLEETFSLLIHW